MNPSLRGFLIIIAIVALIVVLQLEATLAALLILARRPGLTVFAGALAIAFSGILFRVAHVSPSTGAFYRCFWALPALWPVARWERRRWGRRPLRAHAFAWLAGLFFTGDLILWHNA